MVQLQWISLYELHSERGMKMLNREEYEKTYVRMMDSIRSSYKGSRSCTGANCSRCPLENACTDSQSRIFDSAKHMEIVDQWGKDHPVVTNGDKFKEVFGATREQICFRPDSKDSCTEVGCNCLKCKYGVNGEYHAPESVNK